MQTSGRSAIIVREITQYASLGIWALVGFFFWVPFLARAIAIFSGSILYYTITGRDASHLAAYLETAINFYSRGFRLITLTFSNIDSPQAVRSYEVMPFEATRVIVEILSAVIFWGGIALLLVVPWSAHHGR